ncbi:MAG: M1 family metallopeptidase, partial [candidate division WOR-3 bacterium]
IRLDLPMDTSYLSGSVTIACRSNVNNLRVVDLHLLTMHVDSVKVNGLSATYLHRNDTLFINLPNPQNQNDSFSIMVGYSGCGSGLMGYVFFRGNPNVSYTLGCPFSTREWLPCWDRLADKADYGVEFYITVPESFTVCATGRYLGRTVSQGKATYHWKHNYPISPYLIHFASSIFMTYSDWYRPVPTESIEIKYYFWPQDSLYARNAFALVTDMMKFYDSLFGAYPFERYGMDVVDPFYYGGMEHQTMATIMRGWIINNEIYGIAHEMSHMWWGDMVTCYGWENVWLNEGFATYCDALYKEKREGHNAFITLMNSRRSAYFQGEARYPHPIYDPPPDRIFEWSHSYCKGSWVLHMIRYLCGNDQTWLNLMKTYRDSFAYQNARTADLNRIMNRVLNNNYDWFFQEWVYNMGYPIYNVVWRKVSEPPNWRLVMDIYQTQTIGPPVFHMPLPIGVNFSSGDTLITVAINQSPQHYERILSKEPVSIVVDPYNWILQRNTITAISEIASNGFNTIQMPTVGRIIDINLSEPAWVRVFDIAGRKNFETFGKRINYRPSGPGIYSIFIGSRRYRFVIIR